MCVCVFLSWATLRAWPFHCPKYRVQRNLASEGEVIIYSWHELLGTPRRRQRHQVENRQSRLSQLPLLWFCQALLISSLNALVQSAGFSLKTQPRLLLLPISSHGLTTAAVSSWVHLILSSSLSIKFKTLLQDSFFRHPATNTQHLSWKNNNCTGFPFQNALNIKSLVCVSML